MLDVIFKTTTQYKEPIFNAADWIPNLISLAAISISIISIRRDTKLTLLENRLEIYKYVTKACSMINKAISYRNEKRRDWILASLLFEYGSEEYRKAREICRIKDVISREENEDEVQKLELEMQKKSLEFNTYYYQIMLKNDDVSMRAGFLFSDSIKSRIETVFRSYEALIGGLCLLNSDEYKNFIVDNEQKMSSIDTNKLLEDMEKKIWRKRSWARRWGKRLNKILEEIKCDKSK